MMSSEAVPIGHRDEQGVTLGESSAGTAHAAVTMRFTFSGVRYSRLRLASFGWPTGGCFWRFAENDVWRMSITTAIVFVPYRFERSHFAEIGQFGQCSPGDPRPDYFSDMMCSGRRRRRVAFRTGVGITCTLNKRRQTVESLSGSNVPVYGSC